MRLRDSQEHFQESQKALRDSQKAFQYSQTEFYDSQEEFQASQEELQGSQQELQDNHGYAEDYERAIESIRLRLFQKRGKAKEYAEAQEIYAEILDNYNEATPPEAILKMKYSFVDQLLEQGKLERGKLVQAKATAWGVWKTRRDLDLRSEEPNTVSEELKKTHRQICLIYTLLDDFAAAERQQKLVYKVEDEEPKTLGCSRTEMRFALR